MLPVVALEVVAGDWATPAHVAEMVTACSSSLRGAVCATQRASDREAVAVVRVAWQSDTQVTLDVHFEAAEQHPRTSRLLVFLPSDVVGERWRTVGFTAASMVGDQTPAEVQAPYVARGSLDARVTAGTGPIDSGPRIGAAARFGLAPWDTWIGFGASVAYASSSFSEPGAKVDVRSVDLGFGLGLTLAPGPRVESMLRLEAVAENVEPRNPGRRERLRV